MGLPQAYKLGAPRLRGEMDAWDCLRQVRVQHMPRPLLLPPASILFHRGLHLPSRTFSYSPLHGAGRYQPSLVHEHMHAVYQLRQQAARSARVARGVTRSKDSLFGAILLCALIMV
jgi:hypothetical protein